MANAMSVTIHPLSSIKQTSVIGLVSMVAVLHSHIYWFYSVIYIAYNKISPHGKVTNKRWRSYQGKVKQSSKRSTVYKKSEIRLSIVSPPISSATLLLKKSIPLLKALETYPSAKKQPFDIRQFIKTERATPKRIRSSGHMRSSDIKLQTLIEVDTRQQVPDIVVSTSDDEVITGKLTSQIGRKRSNSKRDKALILLRSTFQRNNNNINKENDIDNSTLIASSDEQQDPAPIPKKRRRRNTLLSITRKFSARNNSSSSFAQKQSSSEESIPSMQTKPTMKKESRKLFRSFSLWKNKK